MYNFVYHSPETLDAALAILAEEPEAQALAGGMTLVPTMKQRLANPGHLVDLGAVPDLKNIRESEDGHLSVGAMVTHASVAASDVVRARNPALAELANMIGDPQVRNRGTIGGSIANNDPAADYPAALLALNAQVVTNRREISADAFFRGLFETALEPGELVTDVNFPSPRRAAYAKFANPASRYAIVGVFVTEETDGVRVAVTGAGPSVFRVVDMEQALAADFAEGALNDVSFSFPDLNEDMHASADYRAHLIGVMARRAVAAAQEPRAP